MPTLTLKSILNPRSTNYPTVVALRDALGSNTCVLDASGKILLGEISPTPIPSHPRIPVQLDGITLGHVTGPAPAANALAILLAQLAAREQESRSLAAEVLHLYREVNLIEQLSEQLAALLNAPAVGRAALHQAQRLIPATHGVVLLTNKETGQLEIAASFTPSDQPSENESAHATTLTDPIPDTPVPSPPVPSPLSPTSPFTQSILDRGIGEIITDLTLDPRIQDPRLQRPGPLVPQSPGPSTPDPTPSSPCTPSSPPPSAAAQPPSA